jgi:hypothetical protein
MLSLPSALVRAARLGSLAGALLLAGSVLPRVASPALAQAAGCGDIQKMLVERKTLASSLAPKKKGEKLDARFACGQFGKLVSNGSTLIKWVDTNKDWCQIPDAFIGGIKADHERAIKIRGQACSVAAKMQQMEKQAKQGGGPAAAGLLGGGGLEGPTRLPQGAL